MFVIFGWLKEKQPVKPVLNCYCYVCQRKSEWEVLRETEWVTFFAMKTVPFLSKEFLACGRCGDESALSKAEAKHLPSGGEAPQMLRRLEEMQLAHKSEVQRNFLLSARAARESESAGA